MLAGWARNQQIQLDANAHSWRGTPPFQRIVIRHIPDSAAQLLAVQRGDVDVAFNLIPEQIATLKGDAKVRVEGLTSLDFVYMAVNQQSGAQQGAGGRRRRGRRSARRSTMTAS